MPDLRIDRGTLKEIVANLNRRQDSEWCVACGAGAAVAKLEQQPEIKRVAEQFLDPKVLREFVTSIKDIGLETAWCVACGAGAASSPLARVLPADITDAEIDRLAQQLITAVRLG
jgi:hypothetical protein